MRVAAAVVLVAVALLATSATRALPLDGHDAGVVQGIMQDFDDNDGDGGTGGTGGGAGSPSTSGSASSSAPTAATPAPAQVQNKLVVPWDVLVASPASEGIQIHDLPQYSVGREGYAMPEVLSAYVDG